jgi:hypothetical protein
MSKLLEDEKVASAVQAVATRARNVDAAGNFMFSLQLVLSNVERNYNVLVQ